MSVITSYSIHYTKLYEDDDARLVAVATQQGEVIDQHFGHAKRFHIYSVNSEGVTFVGERHVAQYCQGQTECDDHEDVMMDTLTLLQDMDAIRITSYNVCYTKLLRLQPATVICSTPSQLWITLQSHRMR